MHHFISMLNNKKVYTHTHSSAALRALLLAEDWGCPRGAHCDAIQVGRGFPKGKRTRGLEKSRFEMRKLLQLCVAEPTIKPNTKKRINNGRMRACLDICSRSFKSGEVKNLVAQRKCDHALRLGDHGSEKRRYIEIGSKIFFFDKSQPVNIMLYALTYEKGAARQNLFQLLLCLFQTGSIHQIRFRDAGERSQVARNRQTRLHKTVKKSLFIGSHAGNTSHAAVSVPPSCGHALYIYRVNIAKIGDPGRRKERRRPFRRELKCWGIGPKRRHFTTSAKTSLVFSTIILIMGSGQKRERERERAGSGCVLPSFWWR